MLFSFDLMLCDQNTANILIKLVNQIFVGEDRY